MADLDWKQIAGPLASVGATVLGTVVGGPAGAVVGKAVGGAIASALGVDETPEAVSAAIEKDPAGAKAAIDRNSDDIAAALAQAQAEMMRIVNETYRLELQSESWVVRMWRPICGWCLAFVWTLHGVSIGYALWMKQFEIIRTIGDLTVFYGVMGAVVGVTAWGRTREKIAGAADGLASAIGTLAQQGVKALRK